MYGARGADEAVLEELQGVISSDGALGQSEVIKTIKVSFVHVWTASNRQARTDLLKALLVEQVVGGFKQAISMEEGEEPRMVVQKEVKLQRPRSKLVHPVAPRS